MRTLLNKFTALFLLLLASPMLSAAEAPYQVQKGDTLISILKSQNYSNDYVEIWPLLDAIETLNPGVFLDGNLDQLFPGTVLVMPDNPGKPAPEPAPEPEPEPVPASDPVPEPEPEPLPIPEAEPFIGKLLLKKGTATIKRAGDQIFVGGEVDLLESDVVNVGFNSLADVNLTDQTLFQLGPDSVLEIEQYELLEPEIGVTEPQGSMVVTVSQGVVRAITGLLSGLKSNEYRVSSALFATIGVRGTDFTLRACMSTEDCGDLYGVSVAVQDGGISFENNAAEIDLNQNEFAQVMSATEVPVAGPIPEGFFDLELNVQEIKTDKSIFERVTDWFKSFF